MSPLTIGLIAIAVVLILVFLRVPVAFAFAITGFCGMWYIKDLGAAFNTIATVPYRTVSMYTWSVVPMFVLMGYLAMQTNLAAEFYAGVRKWIGPLRGGLAASVIAGNAAFGAVCGVPISAAVTFSVISLPEMRKYGYADSLTLGSISAGSVLSVLIPPSIAFIIYGAITMTSIGELFIAGILPGVLLAVLYVGTIYILCKRNPALGPPSSRTTRVEKTGGVPGMWLLIIMFVVMIGGLYVGIFTPTEAGAVGAFLVIVFGLARRRLNWQGFKKALLDTGFTAGMVFLLIIGVSIFNLFLTITRLPQAVASFIGGVTQSPIAVQLIIALLYLFFGTFMDAVAVLLVTLPIFFPLVVSLGVHPLTFGVMTTLVSVIGGLTPPYGMIVYAMGGVIKDVPMFKIFRAVAPFLIAMIICLLVVIFFPEINTWLPSTMR